MCTLLLFLVDAGRVFVPWKGIKILDWSINYREVISVSINKSKDIIGESDLMDEDGDDGE